MVLVSYSGREINAKLVYYGPGLSGKTTNLEYIYGSIPQGQRGKMVSMKTKTERTLFFDFLPVHLGELSGFKTRFLLYTVPGQVYYNATRKLVLKGVDAVVFVADSKRGKMDENVESLENLKENLREHDLALDRLPWVMQYNKRDLADVYSVEELEAVLNPDRVPCYEAIATTGQGVVETFKGVSRLLLRKLAKEIGVPVTGLVTENRPAATGPAAPEPAVEPTPRAGLAPSIGASTPAEMRPSAPVEPSPLERTVLPIEPAIPIEMRAPAMDAPPPAGWSEPPRASVESAPMPPPVEHPFAPSPDPASTRFDQESRERSSVGDRLRRWLTRGGEREREEDTAGAGAFAGADHASTSWNTPPSGERPIWTETETRAPEQPAPREPEARMAGAPQWREEERVSFAHPSAAASTEFTSRTFEVEPPAPPIPKEPMQHEPARVEPSVTAPPPPSPEAVQAQAERPAPPAPVAELVLPPARGEGGSKPPKKRPREIIVPVELERADLENGIVLKLAMHAGWTAEQADDEEDQAAA